MWAVVGVVLLLRDGGSGDGEAPSAALLEDGAGPTADAADGRPAPGGGGDAGATRGTDGDAAAASASRPGLAARPRGPEEAATFWARCLGAWLAADETPRHPDLLDEARARLLTLPEEVFEAVAACRAVLRGPGRHAISAEHNPHRFLSLVLRHPDVPGRVREALVEHGAAFIKALARSPDALGWGPVLAALRPPHGAWLQVLVDACASVAYSDEPPMPQPPGVSADVLRHLALRQQQRRATAVPLGISQAAAEIAAHADAIEVAPLLEAWWRVGVPACDEEANSGLPPGMEAILQYLATRPSGWSTGRVQAWRAVLLSWFDEYPDRFIRSPSLARLVMVFDLPAVPWMARLLAAGDPQGEAHALALLQGMDGTLAPEIRELAGAVAASGPPYLALAFARRLVTEGGAPREVLLALTLQALLAPPSGREAIKLLPHVTEHVEEVRPAIERLLASDASGLAPIAGEAIAALGTLPAREHRDLVRFLETVATHGDPEVRVAVMGSLVVTLHLPGDQQVAVRLLDAGLADRDTRVNAAAAEALGWMAQRHTGLRPLLARHATHRDPATAELLTAWAEELAEHDAEVADEAHSAR